MGINLGILGGGWFGREAHLKNLLGLSDVTVVAVSSRSEESRTAAKAVAGDSLQTFADWRELLKMPALDAVIIALTNDQHCSAALAAFSAGLHVLCEKPLGLTIRECNQMIDAGHAAGRVLQVGHELRHQQLYQRMRLMINAGEIGDPRIIWCREYRGPMRPGWRSREDLTGGMLLEKNCHHFDLFNWLLDAQPVRVAAFGGRNVLLDRELLDNAQVLVEYEGSRRAVLEICLFAPVGGDCEVGIVGSHGRLDSWNQALRLSLHRFDPPAQEEVRVPEPEDEAGFRDASGRMDRGIRAQLIDFLDCCRTGRTPLNSGESARLNVAVCLAAQAAIRRGELVTIDEILSS